ncbi:hypothetical protein OIU84_013093 [Salix udensis]|uniref:Uncharacterized protein n=1 Tax=Salix udensis TaxID=889485 RepID=A0AAD6JJ65_9ROSI|nr:hypothetical protein OIU84_013093 [Salix udensis]
MTKLTRYVFSSGFPVAYGESDESDPRQVGAASMMPWSVSESYCFVAIPNRPLTDHQRSASAMIVPVRDDKTAPRGTEFQVCEMIMRKWTMVSRGRRHLNLFICCG